MIRKPFRVSADYIDWAHGPGAESEQPLAMRICATEVHPAPSPYMLFDDPQLVREIASVAELYCNHERGDNDRRAARVRVRAIQWLENL